MENTPVDILISWDSTGSMYPCLSQVKRVVEKLVKDLFCKVPNIKIAAISHGDYCDGPNVMTKFDFSDNQRAICDFIKAAPPTSGGDCPECYELVLHEARAMQWRAEAKKVLLLIGDDVPHHAHEAQNKKKLDWKNELRMLGELDVKVYAVHAMPECRRHSKNFYEEVARISDGYYLTLEQFSTVNDLITAVCLNKLAIISLKSSKKPWMLQES